MHTRTATRRTPTALFLTEGQAAHLLGIHPSTLHRLAHAGKAPVEPVWVTDHTRRYPRRAIERLAGIGDDHEG
jgi:predicted site-specific integrase-resolvase